MTIRAFCIHAADNVATLLDDVRGAEVVRILGASSVSELTALDPIALGHKLALRDIAKGQPIVKFGVRIGDATCDIHVGHWVHLHNCSSGFDQRSQTLDLHTGAATDTRYE